MVWQTGLYNMKTRNYCLVRGLPSNKKQQFEHKLKKCWSSACLELESDVWIGFLRRCSKKLLEWRGTGRCQEHATCDLTRLGQRPGEFAFFCYIPTHPQPMRPPLPIRLHLKPFRCSSKNNPWPTLGGQSIFCFAFSHLVLVDFHFRDLFKVARQEKWPRYVR